MLLRNSMKALKAKLADESTRKVLKEKIDSVDVLLKQKLTSTSRTKDCYETSAQAEAITKVESSQKRKLVDEAKLKQPQELL